MLIGFAHRKQSGKDTAAQFLAIRYGFQKIAFADPLKQALKLIYNFSHLQLYGSEADKTAIDPRWGLSPRDAMQRFGQGMRDIFGEDVWVKNAEARIQILLGKVTVTPQNVESIFQVINAYHSPVRHIVVSDVRHPNEAQMIQRNGGVVVQVVRPSLGPPVDQHPSEVGMENFEYDGTILNDGSIGSFFDQIDKLFLEYGNVG